MPVVGPKDELWIVCASISAISRLLPQGAQAPPTLPLQQLSRKHSNTFGLSIDLNVTHDKREVSAVQAADQYRQAYDRTTPA